MKRKLLSCTGVVLLLIYPLTWIKGQCIIFQENFNSGLGQFSAMNSSNGSWVFTNSCSQSTAGGHTAPGSALFQGSGCQFGNGSLTVSGNLVSPSISVPSTGATLSFNYYVANECTTVPCFYDVLRVQISNNNGATYTDIYSTNSSPGGLLYGGWHNMSYNLSSYAGQNIIIRFNFNSVDGIANAYDGIYIDDVEISALCPYPNDAGVVSIDTPYVPTCSIGNSNIVVTLQNLGTDTLTSCTINWEVNGVPQTPYNWTGSLPPLQTLSNVNIGNYTFTAGDFLKVYSSNPNGVNDSIPSNDTSTVALYPSLSGTLYIGGPTPDYASFTDAVNALNNYGVCGPVTFVVHDSTFNEQIILTTATGMNATNTVTFKGNTNGNSVLTFNSTSTANNYVVRFNNADYFRFEDLQIINTGTTYAYVLEFIDGSDNNIINHCLLMNDTNTTTTSSLKSVVYKSSSGTVNNNTFINNTIKGGSYGFYWYGQNTTLRNTNTKFIGNQFSHQYYTTLYIYYADDVTIENNTFNPSPNYTSITYVGYFYYINNFKKFYNNKIIHKKPAGTMYGTYMFQTNGTASSPSLFANNFIALGDTLNASTQYGFYASTCSYINFYNNNFNLLNNGNTYPVYITGGGGFNIINNNIAAPKTTGGYALYISSSFLNQSNNNNFYIPLSTNFGFFNTAYPSFYAWQINTGFDGNSLNIDPLYHSQYDLHSCQDSLAGAGMHFTFLPTDIDGDNRNPSLPYIGADVFANPSSNNFLGPDINKCPGDTVIIGFPESNGTFGWLPSGDTTATIAVVAPGTYTLNASNACGTGFDQVTITDIPNPVANFTYTSSQFVYVFNNTSTNATSYFWDFGDGNTSTDENPSHIYQSGDTHTVTLIAYGPCSSDTITYTVPNAINNITSHHTSNDVMLYPNPTSGELILRFNETQPNVVLEVINMQGQVVYANTYQVSKGEKLLLNLSTLANGIYTFHLYNERFSKLERIVKQ